MQQQPLLPLPARIARPFSLAQTAFFLVGGAWAVSCLGERVEPWGLGEGTALIICTSIASRRCPFDFRCHAEASSCIRGHAHVICQPPELRGSSLWRRASRRWQDAWHARSGGHRLSLRWLRATQLGKGRRDTWLAPEACSYAHRHTIHDTMDTPVKVLCWPFKSTPARPQLLQGCEASQLVCTYSTLPAAGLHAS